MPKLSWKLLVLILYKARGKLKYPEIAQITKDLGLNQDSQLPSSRPTIYPEICICCGNFTGLESYNFLLGCSKCPNQESDFAYLDPSQLQYWVSRLTQSTIRSGEQIRSLHQLLYQALKELGETKP